MNKFSSISVFGLGLLSVSAVYALEPVKVGSVTVTPSLVLSAGYIYNKNEAFGGATSSTGLPVDKTSSRMEAYAKPGLSLTGPETNLGSLYGGFSAVGALTRGGTDGNGLTRDDPSSVSFETAYVGWKSGEIFPSLQKDALNFSAGRQNFIMGDGFLIGDGHLDQGKDAALWLGGRTAFHETYLAQLDYQKFHADLFDILSHNDVDYLDYRDRLRLRGANFEWREEATTLGASFVKTQDADNEIRDNIKVYNLRFKSSPFKTLLDLNFAAGYVLEKKGSNDANAWYAQSSYSFSQLPWQPTLTYRRSEFSADYDALNFTYMGEWGTWFQGEIVGEYMVFQNNAKIDMLKLSAHPTGNLGVGIIGYKTQRYTPLAGGSGRRDFANEYNIYADWMATDKVIVQTLIGVAVPGDAARDVYGAKDTSHIFETAITWLF